MRDQENIKKLFRKAEQIYFDFSQSPTLIKCKEKNKLETKILREKDMSRWIKAQSEFLRWAQDEETFTKESIERGKMAYDALFKKRGYLIGNILDIGGGWGLYRQWWEPGESDVFIVHDPGVERFLHGPHRLHHQNYQKAFSLPMTFVEGFGEELPYKNDIFDTCLIAATLDHCIYPQKVLAEAYRCLRPSGTILIIQSCHSSQLHNRSLSFLKRLLKHLRHPKHFLAIFRNWLFHTEHHLHHFSTVDITLLLEQTGFSKIRTNTVQILENVYTFEATKEPLNVA